MNCALQPQACPIQYDLSFKFLTTLDECSDLLLSEYEAGLLKKFLHYIKNSYFRENH